MQVNEEEEAHNVDLEPCSSVTQSDVVSISGPINLRRQKLIFQVVGKQSVERWLFFGRSLEDSFYSPRDANEDIFIDIDNCGLSQLNGEINKSLCLFGLGAIHITQ